MNREINFRGLKVSTNEWVYGYYSVVNINHGIWARIKTQFPEWYQVHGETVGQYTGLKDKNGVEIYEGDILKVTNPYNNNESIDGAEVIFSKDYVGGWVISAGGHNLNLGSREKYIRVIGNIYENPELLK